MVKVADPVASIEFVYVGPVDIKDMQDFLKKWLKKNNYDPVEKNYETRGAGEAKNTVLKWEADKKVDDYHRFILKPEISVNNYKDVKIEGKKLVDGEVKVKIAAELERDYEENWKGDPLKKFFRGFFDKFIANEKENELSKLLKKEAGEFTEALKSYFSAE